MTPQEENAILVREVNRHRKRLGYTFMRREFTGPSAEFDSIEEYNEELRHNIEEYKTRRSFEEIEANRVK